MNAHTPVSSLPYDVEAVRADFPILARQVHGRPLIYLDNAASAQKPRQVLDAMRRTYEEAYANVHRGLHTLSGEATEAYEAARETVRAFINAGSLDEVIFTRSATMAINLVASSYGRLAVGEGDEIVLSIMEHHSNIVPWHFLRERNGAVIRWAGVNDDGSFDLAGYETLLNERTKIVAITHMSNVLGTVTPLREVIALAHARGIPVLVDGSQGAVHLPVDVQALDVDFYVMTGHKLYGPTGIGVLYAKRKWIDAMPPYEGGGEMIAEVGREGVTYGEGALKFEAGTPPIVEAVGLAAGLDYMTALGRGRILAHEEALRDLARERLGRINSLRILGDAPGKGAIMTFELAGAHAHDVSTLVDRQGVAVRAGTHCAQPLMARFGTTSTCRASFGLYNTAEEVEVLGQSLERAARMLT